MPPRRKSKTRPPAAYNTNLAAEFHVMSVLHRMGFDASLTLGNKKAVDIVVVRDSGDAVTIDAKGISGTTGWPANNIKTKSDRHFLVFVCYLGRIGDPSVQPEVYVVPSKRVPALVYHSPNSDRCSHVGLRRG